ncbi:MAG: GGDEF domain-containing protein [Christensenellales bacterium]
MPGVEAYFLTYFFNTLLMIIDVIPAMLWTAYVTYHISRDIIRLDKINVPILLIFIINTALSISNIKTGWYFSIGADNLFIRGPLYWLNVAFSSIGVVYSTIIVALNRKKLERGLYKGLIVFAVPGAVGAILQLFYEGGAITWAGLSVSVLTVYFNIQNKTINTDYLTGAYNRRQLDHYLTDMIENRGKKSFAAILIDLDRFKQINDKYGHSVGDSVLCAAAKLLRECVRADDFIARYGGDEFCVVIEDIDVMDKLEEVVRRIKYRFAKYNHSSYEQVKINISMGYDVYRQSSGQSFMQFISHIDRLMYKEKKKTIGAQPLIAYSE